MNTFHNLLEKFKGKNIIVIGDCMLDKYIWGEVSRISPEAPVQVIDVQKETYAAGGAANVAMNASALGAKVSMVGITGDDEGRRLLLGVLKDKDVEIRGLMIEEDKPTTVKMRIMGRSQQLLRVDYEKRVHAHPKIEKQLLSFVMERLPESDAIIVSDYAKGVVTKKLISTIIDEARKKGKIVVVDPKPQHKSLYKGATVITPNHLEACQMANSEVVNGEEIKEIGKRLSSELETAILLTRGEKGMSLFEKSGDSVTIPAQAKEVYDVTGAGDTVVATIALALSSGASMKEAAILANHAAGIKVGKIGTSTVSVEEIRKSLDHE